MDLLYNFTISFFVLKMLTIQFAIGKVDKVTVLQGQNGISLDSTLTTGNLTLLLSINSIGFFLAFRVLDDELEDTIDLKKNRFLVS